jgi:hypothetical protein
MRFGLITIMSFLAACQVNGQVLIKGPETASPGTMQTITLDQVLGEDLKVEAFQAGLSTKANWNIFKNLDNKYVILVLPQPGDTLYTFVAAVNNEKKTYLSTFCMTVKSVNPPTKASCVQHTKQVPIPLHSTC